MSNKKLVKITLKGSLSLSIGRFRFEKDRPVKTTDKELIAYCSNHPDFKCVALEPEKKKSSAPKSKPAPKDEPKAENNDSPTEDESESMDEDLDLDITDEGQDDTESPQQLMRRK